MYLMDYDSVKVTNYVQRFCIIPRVSNGVAEFTLLVQLVNNERTEVYDDTYEDPRDLLHDLRNGWYYSDKLMKERGIDSKMFLSDQYYISDKELDAIVHYIFEVAFTRLLCK